MTLFDIPAPSFEWFELSPVLVVLVAACLGILLEALLPRQARFTTQLVVVELATLVAFVMLVLNWRRDNSGVLAMGAVTLDGPTYIMWGALLVFSLLAMLVFAERDLDNGVSAFSAAASSVPGSQLEAEATQARLEHSEVFPLALFSLSGMMIFAASNDLLTMFVALEVMSLPLYLLSAMARRRRLLSQEAGLKYFMLGAFSSAFFLFGIAMLYGYSGSFQLSAIDAAIASPVFGSGILYLGMAMLAVGLLFKVGAVPFQSWVPDVYVGAPTPVTGFMAICTKLAAVGGLARVFYVALGAERWSWQPLLAVVALITMAVGVVLALTQTDIKRMLAYSSIAHAGFLLVAVVGALADVPSGQMNSMASILFYLVAYGFATIAAFAIVTMVRDQTGEAHGIARWAGVGKKNPVLAGIFAVLMLSFAGIPLTGGFIGKWAVFQAAWLGGYSWLVLAAIGFSLVAAYFYIKVIVVMFFSEPDETVVVGKASGLTWVPVVVGAVASVYLGLFPGQLLNLVSQAGIFLR
ncbi:MAG: NADH-quinone oxidoreductase subunit NuoN [Propionicimonas sp.]|nr:NADH-quinone oxidoreductase subunit NuoN [Propionicimonas sp.]MEA5118150.1 NADH-quinone oxidoreductase subunit NuoN [Propionicimonas sp.]